MEITRFSSIQFIKIPRNVWTTTITRFLNDITNKLIFTLVPLFLANVLSVSTVIIGLIGRLAETTSSLLKGIFRLATRSNRVQIAYY